ncbi:MAG TPA: MBL fold metallo-hydrolase, partial [Syntrophales bacterium]|nr:MBL fold metallo-hydrolase [Syntrophales bacterium]
MRENISWLGHSSVRIRAGKQVIYIDPWKLKEGAEKADIILISHSHYDHFSPGDVKKIRKENTVILASADVAAELGGDAEILLDTGIMSGADIVAAIALGARFTLIGRAYLYGLM